MINVKGKIMRIKNIKALGNLPVYDITVNSNDYDKQHYILENGVISHNTGGYYSSDAIWILGRQQDKDDKTKELEGYHFVINIEKSRYVKEKSKIPITVSFEGGINRWSGLLDIALEGGYLVKPKNGWYALVDRTTGEVQEPSKRAADIVDNKAFWVKMFTDTDFSKYIEKTYKMSHGAIMGDDDAATS